MNRILNVALITICFVFIGCSDLRSQDSKKVLSVEAFSSAIKNNAHVLILDVRTPEEFSNGHIENAINYDWNGSSFNEQVATLDKATPIYVYCLSGKRSAAAAAQMRQDGFKEVYEMEGGMLKWRSLNLAEVTAKSGVTMSGMTIENFHSLLNTDKLVLIDYYADWCMPCKKIKPFLDQIAAERKDVMVVRINVDENRTVAEEMKIDALPTLQLFKGGSSTWKYVGYIDKQDILSHLK